MRKLVLTVAAIVAAGLVVVATGAAAAPPPSYQGIAPVVYAGNPDCKDLTGWVDPSVTYSTQIKFVLPVNGTNGGGMNVAIDANTAVGTGIGWYVNNNEDVRAVIVKGGPSANVYFYPAHPATGDFVDGSMTTPGTFDLRKGQWKFPAVSYMEFCYFPTVYVPPS
jgi:hypothetical protein